MLIFDFNKNSNISDWKTTNDTVMGGKSESQFLLNDDGNGVFKGQVSLENNGGFSSVKYKFESKKIEGFTSIVLKLKGDGNTYNFRVKADTEQQHSFNYKFETKDHWETIEVPLSELYPIYRGKKLSLPNFSNKVLVQVTFLIANRQKESFQLEIATIGLK